MQNVLSAPMASPPILPFPLLSKGKRRRPPQNCIWTDRSNSNAYWWANSPLSAPTAVLYQNQASMKVRDPGTGSRYRLLLPPFFTASSLLAPVSRGHWFHSPLGYGSFEPIPHLFHRPLCDCPAQMCPNLHFLVRACRDLMALGNLAGDSHPPPTMGPGAPAQVR